MERGSKSFERPVRERRRVGCEYKPRRHRPGPVWFAPRRPESSGGCSGWQLSPSDPRARPRRRAFTSSMADASKKSDRAPRGEAGGRRSLLRSKWLYAGLSVAILWRRARFGIFSFPLSRNIIFECISFLFLHRFDVIVIAFAEIDLPQRHQNLLFARKKNSFDSIHWLVVVTLL